MKLKVGGILVLVLLLSFSLVSFADVSTSTDYDTYEAEALKDLGLFKGTDKGFELEREPKRVEAAAMLVKLLGKEELANKMKYEHPFTDVPAWADAIVGYLYHEGLTNGVSDTLFGSNKLMTARDYTVFILKALGYGSDDFDYKETLRFAQSLGIFTIQESVLYQGSSFKRADMVHISYNALSTSLKDQDRFLIYRLYLDGVVSQSAITASTFTPSYVKIFPYQDEPEWSFNDHFMNLEATPSEYYFNNMVTLGEPETSGVAPCSELYIELNHRYRIWDDQILVATVSLMKDNDIVYVDNVISDRYTPKEDGILSSLYFNIPIPEVDYDYLYVYVTPMIALDFDFSIDVTHFNSTDVEAIKKALKESHAFSIVYADKASELKESEYYDMGIIMIMTVEGYWSQVMSNTDYTDSFIFTESYKPSFQLKFVNSDELSYSTTNYFSLDLPYPDNAIYDYYFGLYDEDGNLYRILIIDK